MDFLRSGEKDIHAFAESRRGRKQPSQTSLSTGLQTDVILDGTLSREAGTGE